MKINIKILLMITVILLVVLLLVLWKWDKIVGKKVLPIQTKSTTVGKNIPLIKIPRKYNQNDKRWSSDLLGNTRESLGKIGCLVSSVAMNLSYYNINMNPKKLNEVLSNIDGYTSGGWLIWSKLEDVTDGKVEIYFPKLSHATIDDLLQAKKPVLVKILIRQMIPHWVLIVGKKDNEYIIYDPLDSEIPTSISKYNSLIYAIRVLEQ